MHISQLRKASEKARASEKEANTIPRARPRDLKLSLEEGDDPKDILPPFSQFETFSVELLLGNIFATIANENIRYVGLFSTDIRDQIFLANAIRRRAPNVVLFTLGADLLYLHSDVNVDFNGMLLITTYPLFNKNEVWIPPFKGEEFRIQFPNHTAHGVYNATLALLCKSEKMLEYGYPLLIHQRCNAPRYPPLWLAVVGKDNIWPIKYFAPSDSIDDVLQTKGDQKITPTQACTRSVFFMHSVC